MTSSIKGYAICMFLFMIIRGTSYFELATQTTKAFGTNSWIMLIVFSLIIIVQLWFIYVGSIKHNNQSALQLIRYRLPNWLGNAILAMLLIVYVFLSYRMAFSFIRVLQFTTGPLIKLQFVTVILLIVSAVIAGHGIYTITKSASVFFCMSMWIVVLGLMQFDDFSLTRLTPYILQGGSWEIGSILDVISAFQGYLIIIYITPYLKQKLNWFKYLAFSQLFIGAYYTVNCFLTQGLVPYEMLLNINHVLLRINGGSRITALEYITDLLFITFIFSSAIATATFMWISAQAVEYIIQGKPKNQGKGQEQICAESQQKTIKYPWIIKISILIGTIILAYLPINYNTWNMIFRVLSVILLVLSFVCPLMYWILPKKSEDSQSTNDSTVSGNQMRTSSSEYEEGSSSI